MMDNNWVAYDTETTGLNRHIEDVKMFSYSLGNPDGTTSVHRIDRSNIRLQNEGRLLEIWGDDYLDVAKVAHNMKFDAGMTQKWGKGRINVSLHPWHDTSVQASILYNKHYSMRLKDLCWDLAGIPKDDEKSVKKYLLPGENYSHVPEHLMNKYQHTDALRVVVLHKFFYPKILKDPRLLACYNNEMELLKVTYEMEERGLHLRRQRAVDLRSQLESESEIILQKAGELLGQADSMKRMNLANANVARKLLYEEMGMEVTKKTDTGLPSADKNVLMEMYEKDPGNELLGLILHYRSWRRGIAMMDSYLKFASLRGDDAIHPNINTNGARRTGRESCNSPNLQNVEKGKNEAGKKNPYPVPAREVFGPRPGYVNFHIDYRGIELRLLVEYSGDQILIDAIRDEDLGKGGGPHNLAASYFYPPMGEMEAKRWGIADPDIIAGFDALFTRGQSGDKRAKDSAKVLRDTGKNAHFAGPYGAGPDKIAATLNLPGTLGAERFARYHKLVPKIFGLTAEIVQQVKKHNGITNIFGRSFFVPRDEAYIGTNYLIQGTAAEILKRGTVRTHKVLQTISGTPMRLLVPIHDELIIECPLEFLPDAPAVLQRVREVMVDFPEFKVPMEIDVEISTKDWSLKENFDITKEVKSWQVNVLEKEQTILTFPKGKRRGIIIVP